MFARLGPWCHDHRKLVVIVWVVALFLVNGVAGGVGNGFKDEFNLPDVESRTGFDILDEDFGGQGTGFTGTIVFRSEDGVDDPAVQEQMEALFDEVAAEDDVVRVESPYAEGADHLISRDGLIAYANVELDEDIDFARAGDIANLIEDRAEEIDGVRIELGGFIFADFPEPTTELIGLAFAIVILIGAFGSVLAMGLPIGVALFGIGLGSAVTTLLSNAITIPEFAPFLGIMIGLGVGIDYALLIITRFREQHHAGHDCRESITIAMDTAGRSVLFAGITVVISMLGLLLVGVQFVQGLAISAALTVALTVAASMTLLPALVGFAGERIELTRRRGLIAAGLVAVALFGMGVGIGALAIGFPAAILVLVLGIWVGALRTPVEHRPPKPRRETLAYRWSREIQRHPWPFAIGGAVFLLVLAIPVLSLRLGFADESNYPDDTTTKQAYDLLVEGFGEGFNGPLMLVAELDEGADLDALAPVNDVVTADEGVAFSSPPIPNDPEAPTAVLWNVVPTTGPQSVATEELVERLRDDLLPPVEEELGIDVAVTGNVAVNVDFSDYLSSRLPWVFGAVLLFSFLLLMVVFRSVLVPVKAVVMNLLSISAAYGVLVALFQWGWLSDVIGVEPAPVETWIPMMLFAIVFGLSMDYEVFLLSRVREEWHRTGDSRMSVADGLAATAKVISAAAAIMVVVFGSFLFEWERTFKMMGVGLATAILLDATVVRLLLVPATMELLGDKNWWLPRWLDRILPTIDVEGHAEPVFDDEDEPVEKEPALT